MYTAVKGLTPHTVSSALVSGRLFASFVFVISREFGNLAGQSNSKDFARVQGIR